MKKSMIFFGCLALLAAGCNKIETVEAPVEEPMVESPDHLIVDITVGTESETRAVKTGWENGDKIYVFFDHFFLDYVSDPNIGTDGQGKPKYSSAVCYLTLTYDGSVWQSAFSQPGLETYLLGQPSGTLAAVYYSHMTPQFNAIHGYRGKTEEFFVELANPGNFTGYYLFTEGGTYTVANGRLIAALNMHMNERAVRFVVPGIQSSSRFGRGLQSDQLARVYPSGFSSVNVDGAGFQAPTVNTTSGGNTLYPRFESSEMVYDGCLRTTAYLGQEEEYVLQVSDTRTQNNNKDDLYYTLTKTATLNGREVITLPNFNDTKWVKSYQNHSPERGFHNGIEWVEMGDGRKWAVRNYGDKDSFTDYSANGNGGTFLRWAEVPNALANNWGDGWRLPTKEEWQTLLTHPKTRLENVFNERESFVWVKVARWDDTGSYEVERLYLPIYEYIGYVNGDPVFYGAPDGFYWTGTADPSNSSNAMVLKFIDSESTISQLFYLNKTYQVQVRPILDE